MVTMARPLPRDTGKFIALYRDRNNMWTRANDARGYPIRCDSEELALSVASYRRKRLQPLEA